MPNTDSEPGPIGIVYAGTDGITIFDPGANTYTYLGPYRCAHGRSYRYADECAATDAVPDPEC